MHHYPSRGEENKQKTPEPGPRVQLVVQSDVHVPHNPHPPSSPLPGSLLLPGVAEALQPHGSQQLLAAGLFLLLLLFILLRLTHEDGVRLRRLHLRALPLSALQPPGLLLPAALLAGPAGELPCP